ncbi:hypothetical protein TWF281_011786 [Arthrobotrys megalospora]
MSVAYPNQNTVGPSSDSFSASAAFSFDQHNQTQVFGAMNTDPQSQMQTQMPGQVPNQSLSVPMIQVSQAGFTSDYDMGTAPRDEDIDIDLDLDTYDEDEDMGLDDLATPMATALDDPMDEAANIPASSLLFGQPGPSGAFGRYHNPGQASDDDEMVDDALNQVVNEVMTDAEQPEVPVPFDFQSLVQAQHAQDLRRQQLLQNPIQQSIQQQPSKQPLQQIVEQSAEQSQSQTSLPSSQLAPAESSIIPNIEAPASSPVKTTPTQELPAAVEEQTSNTSSTPFGVEAFQSQPPPSDVQNAEGQPLTEQTLETDKAPVAEEPSGPATPPPHPSPHNDALKTPQPANHNSPQHQTPQSSVDPLRISQAETVALENPTPDVNQRDWYTLDGQVASGSPKIPTYPAHQEIPTSPLHGHAGSGSSRPSFPSEPEAQSPHTPHSEHETEREAPSQSSQQLEEQSSHEQASAHDESQNDSTHDDPLLTHPVVVVYRDLEFSLFPISGEKSNLPETSFLPDRSHVGASLNKLVTALRDVLGEEFTASEELVLNFTALGVEFEEENTQMHNFTLYDIIGLFSKLLVQDGIDEAQPLYISLTSRKKYIPKLEMIHSHIIKGGGLASWKSLLASAHNQPPPHNHNDSASHKYGDHEDVEKGPYLNEQVPELLEKTNVANEKHAEGDDDELELEEFEKGLGGDGDDYYNQQNLLTDMHPATTAVATIDVPKSPSQTIPEKQRPSFTQETSNTDVSNVPETQLSQPLEATPSKKLRLNLLDHSGENSYLKDDEASFVTAQEKQQDISVAYSGSRSYGFPDSPSSSEEPETETGRSGKDDGLLNFDEQDNTHEEDVDQEEDEKSSSTLHEVPEGESNNQATSNLQSSGGDGAGGDTNWHEWAYDGDDVENGEYQYGEGHEENSEYVDAVHDLPEDLNEPTEVTGNDSEIDPFAYYPEPFGNVGNSDNQGSGDNEGDGEHPGDWEHQGAWEHQDNDEPLLGLDHHETLSTTTSTKRAREEDDDEIEDELSEAGEVRDSPTPASKKHKASES